VYAELSMLVSSEEREPRFSVTLMFPDGTRRPRTLTLGGTLYGGWTVAEFSPSEEVVTLEREGQLLVLRRGEAVALPQ